MRRDGFTLIEMMLALLVGSLVSLSVGHVFWSGLKLDEELRRSQDRDLDVLMLNQSLTRDLENALALDYTAIDPEMRSFQGDKQGLSFFTQTPTGIKRVRYYASSAETSAVYESLIRNKLNLGRQRLPSPIPIEFVFRHEMSLTQWAQSSRETVLPQVIAAGVRSGSFACTYARAPAQRTAVELNMMQFAAVWDQKEMPAAVKCRWDMYDYKHPGLENIYQRHFFLAPIDGRDHG